MSCVIICLDLQLPASSSDLPEDPTGRCIVLCLILLRMGFTWTRPVTRTAVVSYTAFSPLPLWAVYFCCTFPGVTSAGRYPASCPSKPGLSSPGNCQPRLHTLLNPLHYLILFPFFCQTIRKGSSCFAGIISQEGQSFLNFFVMYSMKMYSVP